VDRCAQRPRSPPASIDRLARSTFDLFTIVKRTVDAKTQFRSLAEPWAEIGTSTGRLMLAVRLGARGTRSNPHPHRRGQEAGRRSAGSTWADPRN
jgi:DNA invertase Pin-like site-specific DNA recombinase